MPDYIGPIEVPEQAPSGTFPLTVDYPLAQQIAPIVHVHGFLSANAKIEQRFHGGNGARRWMVQKALRQADRESLLAFWAGRAGSWQPFTFNAPNEDGSGGSTAVTVRFANPTLTLEQVSDAIASTGLELVEEITSTPSYSVTATLTRVPSAGMQTALLDAAQTLIPLLRIRVLNGGVADIFLSDRRVTVGASTYLPRILSWNGISQSIGGSNDEASFVLGNADRVLAQLANAVDLYKARLEFSVYHVQSGNKLDLWAGTVTEYDHDEGEQFSLTASDGLHQLTVSYPRRKATRQCWKRYKDGVNCTAASAATNCNKSWDDCVARANTNQFGGILTIQEAATVKDNSTGFAGLGRNTITAASILSENIYGRVLPEIFTDSDMPVECSVMATRDESEFFSALGVVGEGPINAYGSGHLLDDQPHHGPGSLGLRTSLGGHPSNPDLFNIDETSGGEAPFRAAGTAFVQIRRVDAKGIQLTKPADHHMTAVVAQGRTGYVWSAPGSRSSALLTNPVWVAINVFLRALGLENASAAAQEQYFDVSAAVSAAAVCDASVTALVGGGSVQQFRFQGVLADEKPARDWIQEILNNCVGYYTWKFGRLKLGLRLHSGSAEGGAYGVGNIVMGSLKVARRTPEFNHLTVTYADRAKKFAANSVLFYDEDHIAEHGEARASINLVGTSTADQALRILTVRLREELGGATPAEFSAARTIAFRTTVLGLATEPGQVCSLTHEDMPGGSGEFRLVSWRLNSDWSIDYEGVSTTDSMYDLITGPKPGDVTVDPAPGEETPLPLIGVWHPNYETPAGGDPLFDTTQKRFTLRQSYFTQADDVTKCLLSVEGYLPVNRFVTQTRPLLRGVSGSGSGGSLAGNRDYYLQLACYDAAGKLSPPSVPMRVSIPAGSAGSIAVAAVDWPAGAWSGYKIYASHNAHRITLQATVAGALPASVTVTSCANTSNEGIPLPGKDARIRAKVKRIIHSGPIGTNLAAVGANYFEVGPGIITADDEWNGRICSIIADNDGEADLWNFTITDTVLGTNRLVVTPDPAVLGIGTNDTLIIRTKATTFSATQLGDAKWQNGVYPGGNTNDETGTVLRIISGAGAGQVRRVASNTVTVHTVDRPFSPAPDATSVWIIEEASWVHQAESTTVPIEIPNALTKIQVEVSNYLQQSLLVLATLVTDNAESSEEFSPWREIWVYGQDALVGGGIPAIAPVTGVVLTSPLPPGWAANPDYESLPWPPVVRAYVALTYTPPADPEFTGVDVWTKTAAETVEQAVLRGSYAYGGSGNGKVEVAMDRPDADQTLLFHLASKSTNAANAPEFSDSAATEPVALQGLNSLTAAITGATITTTYYGEESGLFWGPTLDMNLPFGNLTWSWCDLTVQWLGVDAAEVLVAGFSRQWTNPIKQIERGWGIPSDEQVAAGQATFRFRLYLYKNDGTKVLQTNPWGNGTPNKDVTISRQLGAAGAENSPNVTANIPGTFAEYSTNQDGVSIFRIRVQMGLPGLTRIKYGGLLVAVAPAATVGDRTTWIEMGTAPATATIYYTRYEPTPAAGSYKIVLLAVDPARRENSYQSGVTPTVDLTIGTQPPALLLSRTKGKLTNVGTQSAFEGIEVKAQSGLFTNETVGWVGNATESASTLDLALSVGQITLRVASIAPYIGLEGRFLRIVHTNGVTYERFRVTVNGINQATRQITMDYTESGAVSFQNAYPVNSQVLIDYQGGWFKNLWVGGTNAQTAPLFVDQVGDLRIESKSSRNPAIRIVKNGIRTVIANQPNAANPSSVFDGLAIEQADNANNFAALSLSGTSGARTPTLSLVQSLFNFLNLSYSDIAGGEIQSYKLSGGSIEDFVISGNRTNSWSVPGSPSTGLRSLLRIATVNIFYKLIHGTRELINSSGDIDAQYVKHRFFNAAYSAATVKSALREGEVATWYDGSASWIVFKHADGSGNAFKLNNDGSL